MMTLTLTVNVGREEVRNLKECAGSHLNGKKRIMSTLRVFVGIEGGYEALIGISNIKIKHQIDSL